MKRYGVRPVRRAVLAGGLAAVLGGHPAAAFRVEKLTVIGNQGWLFFLHDDPRRFSPALMERVGGTLGQAVQIMKAKAIEVVIALLPVKARIYRDFLPEGFTFTPETENRYAMGVGALRQTGATVPDIEAALLAQRRAVPAELLYFKNDTHWTAAGAAAAAAELARAMKAALRLPASRQKGTQLGPASSVTQHNNNLVAFLPREERPSYPAETYRIHPPVARGSLLDEDTADVVLIGNSFMQPMYNCPAYLSNALDRPVSLLWKPQNIGPYRTILDYFNSPVYKRSRPKSLIWTFLETDLNIPVDNRSAWQDNAMTPEAFLGDLRRAVG